MMHKAQIATLYLLRHQETARFHELMKAAGLESDVFKFHLRKLVALRYVAKLPSGAYTLTAGGKEFANNLDEARSSARRQPKLSMLLVVSRIREDGEKVYVTQQRRRNPYFGFWGLISGPVEWGQEIEASAKQELLKQTGLAASFTVRTFYRQRDYAQDAPTLLEDKLFAVLEAHRIEGELDSSWHGGTNEWLSSSELQERKHFPSSLKAIEVIQHPTPYLSEHTTYSPDEY